MDQIIPLLSHLSLEELKELQWVIQDEILERRRANFIFEHTALVGSVGPVMASLDTNTYTQGNGESEK